jgi:pectate lyase-like protein
MTSNLSAFRYIQERDEATPALFNDFLSTLSANIAAVNSNATINLSGATLSIGSSVSIGRDLWVQGSLSVGALPSVATRTAVNIGVRSDTSDYLYFTDEAALRSSYIIGSHVGGTADGLNIWDASGSTMIASFSKQSIRFFQNVVGPVFDVGGALANTLNAATFGTGADSKESRIQAAILQASASAISRVYVPANMYPYSASSVSFIYPVQMVREGGDWSVYDVQAYGAYGDGSHDDGEAIVQALNGGSGRGKTHIPSGVFLTNRYITIPSRTYLQGVGLGFSIVRAASTLTQSIFVNASSSGNTDITIEDLEIDGNKTSRTTGFHLIHFTCNAPNLNEKIYINRVYAHDSFQLGLLFSRVSGGAVTDSQVAYNDRDGVTLYFTSRNFQISRNWIHHCGDDFIGLNAENDTTSGNSMVNIIVTDNVCGPSQVTGGSGIAARGVRNGVIDNNVVLDGFAECIGISNWNTTPAENITVSNNVLINAGSASTILDGDGIKISGARGVSSVSGANGCFHIVLSGNVIVNPRMHGIRLVGNSTSSGTIAHVRVMNNEISCGTINSNGRGILVDAGPVMNVDIDNNSVLSAQAQGILFSTSGFTYDNIALRGNRVVNSGIGGDSPGISLNNIFNVAAFNNQCFDTRVASRTQTFGLRFSSISSSLIAVGNSLYNNKTSNFTIISNPPATIAVIQSPDQSWTTTGNAIQPAYSFNSETSLGWYWSGNSIMGLSYGTLAIPEVLTVGGKFSANSIMRNLANSATLPQWQFFGGSGNDADFAVGRGGQDVILFVANSTNAFNTGNRTGDSGFQTNSNVTFHIAIGNATPQFSVTSLSGRGIVDFRQSGLVSLRTTATSLDSLSLRGNEMAVWTDGSVATLALRSAGTVWFWASSVSTKG